MGTKWGTGAYTGSSTQPFNVRPCNPDVSEMSAAGRPSGQGCGARVYAASR